VATVVYILPAITIDLVDELMSADTVDTEISPDSEMLTVVNVGELIAVVSNTSSVIAAESTVPRTVPTDVLMSVLSIVVVITGMLLGAETLPTVDGMSLEVEPPVAPSGIELPEATDGISVDSAVCVVCSETVAAPLQIAESVTSDMGRAPIVELLLAIIPPSDIDAVCSLVEVAVAALCCTVATSTNPPSLVECNELPIALAETGESIALALLSAAADGPPTVAIDATTDGESFALDVGALAIAGETDCDTLAESPAIENSLD